mmetsp:Transcript_19905/g.28613  ORF Transcript_19905/g.28613 Transcript_19905/m.28613 type:complete len:527 (-) Transcript_19905:175-1755(-)
MVPETSGRWATGLYDCAKDEETCWWGTWCCWMLSARTIQSFELGSSLKHVTIFWVYMLGIMLFTVLGGPLGGLFALIGAVVLAYNRALMRGRIRSKLSISGDFTDDFFKHLCCTCCAVCQEAREANESSFLILDYCSGEKIEVQEEAHEIATGRAGTSLRDRHIEGGSFISHVKALSMTSKIILVLCACVAVCSFVLLFVAGRGQNVAILLLTFVQPVLILYFVYWRSRRQYAALDMVVKLFAVGFWFTTFQSVVLEEVIQFLILLVIGPFIATAVVAESDDKPTSSSSIISGGRLISGLLSLAQSAQEGQDNEDEQQQERMRETMQEHIVLVVFSLFLMAFVVAAGVEETMKHFVVRCCRFPAPLADPHTVLVYLMAGALGFATSENIEYVFGTTTSPIPGTSVFIGELLVLVIRVLMPIHVICSVIQAANLSKVLLGQRPMSLFMILLPAIVLHGCFDFALFLIGTIQFVYDIEGAGLEIASFVIAGALTVGGAVYAYYSFEQVQDNFVSGWHTFANEEENSRL